jgi:hypothetical protein
METPNLTVPDKCSNCEDLQCVLAMYVHRRLRYEESYDEHADEFFELEGVTSRNPDDLSPDAQAILRRRADLMNTFEQKISKRLRLVQDYCTGTLKPSSVETAPCMFSRSYVSAN